MRQTSSRRRFLQRASAASIGVLRAGSAASAGGAQAVARAGTGYVDARKVLLWESTRKEFRDAVEANTLKAMIVPTGSTEQHNEHLAMIQDTASVTLVAQQAALALFPQVMV